MSEWKPIETAPRDGTKFLAYGRGCDAMCYDPEKDMLPVIKVCWRQLFDVEEDEPAGDGLFRKVKRVHDLGWKGGVHFRPTHWMPLPEPPA